jgi:hypothetical protein
MEDLLKKLYYDPETGYGSLDRIYRKAKVLDKDIKLKDVKDFIAKQSVSQITKAVKRPTTYNTIVSPSVKNNYQCDLFILPNPNLNKGYKYLLTCIDVFSRYVVVEPLKTKTGDVVLEAFKKIIKTMKPCNNLNVDEGSEFIYDKFKQYCNNNGITVWYSNPEQSNKNAIIERFHRTLRNLLLKYTTATGKPYIDILPKLIDNYNTTFHRTIKQEPKDIWEGKATNRQKIVKLDIPFNVGDKVRKLNKKATFDKKSSTTNYTKKVYTITKIESNSIYLDELKTPYRVNELVLAVEDGVDTEDYDNVVVEDNRQERIKRRLQKEGILD